MIAVTIPTRFRPKTLGPLLDVLKEDNIPVFLYDSAEHDHNIHVMWNMGVAAAREMGATEIGVLNDDIGIVPGTLALMAQVLRMEPAAAVVIPEYHRNGAPSRKITLPQSSRPRNEEHNNVGYCFLFKAELPLPKFDERLFIHQGDIVFFDWVRAHGYQIVRAEGVHCDHIRSFSVDQTKEDGQQQRDAEMYRRLYPRKNYERAKEALSTPGHRYSYDLARLAMKHPRE